MRVSKIPKSVDEYITMFPPMVQIYLKKIRTIIRKEAPKAVEKISYRMPAYMLDGMLLYIAAHNHHIGIYPPVKGDAAFNKKLAAYRNEKGNLRFQYDQPMPYPLIRAVVKTRIKEHLQKLAMKKSVKKLKKK